MLELDFDGLGSILIMLGAIATLFIPTFFTIGGYKDLEVSKEYELVSLSNETISDSKGNLLYVSLSSDNVYTYRYKLSDYNYKVAQLQGKNKDITEVEEENCDTPRLIVYKKRPKFLWILTFTEPKTYYYFVVPKGSINKEIYLN